MLPEVFRIGGFFLPTYGLLVALAFLISLSLVGKIARNAGLNHEDAINLGIYCALAGILGAKLMMFLIDIPHYAQNPREIFSIETLQAAGVFYGGLLLALPVGAWYMRKKHLPPLRTADIFAPGIALGHAIGRLGCFAAGCCYGTPTSLPWAVIFTNPQAQERSGTPLNVPLHPTQLYESLAEFVIFLLLYRAINRPHRDGSIITAYIMAYSAVRFLVEFVRVHDQPNPFGGPLNTSQWIALALLAGAAAYRWIKVPQIRPA